MKIFCTDFPLIKGGVSEESLADIGNVYIKPDSAMINSGKMLYRPAHIDRLYGMPHLVVRIERVGKCVAPEYAHRYWSMVGVGVAFCGLDGLKGSIERREPYVTLTGFDGALVCSNYYDYKELTLGAVDYIRNTERTPLSLTPPTVIESYISLLSEYFMLKIGDIVTFPLLPRYEEVEIGDNLYIARGEEEMTFVGIR